MRGAKPSSGLVHLHKSFIEAHFAGRSLPQNVSVLACIDGKQLATVLPGQVYSTSCGSDHWLLGLQLIFKAYKTPVITCVDKTGDHEVTVFISTQGLQDKYSSADPLRQVELQQAMEAAALKFAQTAVMRKEGRLQITGPNINIPKKQLRAQWPGILDTLAPQDVQAHIFVDSKDQYISCAARIILTKAKAEPVFYLSGLSQLLKSYSGAFVSLELFPDARVVRLHIDTKQQKLEGPSLSADTDTSSAAQPQRISDAAVDTGNHVGPAPGSTSHVADSGMAQSLGNEGWEHSLTSECKRHTHSTSRRSGEAASLQSISAGDNGPHVSQMMAGQLTATDQAAAQVAEGVAAVSTSPMMQSATTVSQQMGFKYHHWHVKLGCTAGPTTQQHLSPDLGNRGQAETRLQTFDSCHIGQPQPQLAACGLLGATCSNNAMFTHQVAGKTFNSTEGAAPGSTLTSSMQAEAAAVTTGAGTCRELPVQGAKCSTGVSVDSEAGLWLLADHAAQLQAVASANAVAAAPGSAGNADGPVDAAVLTAAAAMCAGGFDPATTGESIHPAALPQVPLTACRAGKVGRKDTAAQAAAYAGMQGQHAATQSKRRRISSNSVAGKIASAAAADSRQQAAQWSPALLGRAADDWVASESAAQLTDDRHSTHAVPPYTAACHSKQQLPAVQQEHFLKEALATVQAVDASCYGAAGTADVVAAVACSTEPTLHSPKAARRCVSAHLGQAASAYVQPMYVGSVPPTTAADSAVLNSLKSEVLSAIEGYDLPCDSGAVAYVHRLDPVGVLTKSSVKPGVALPQVAPSEPSKQHSSGCPGTGIPCRNVGVANWGDANWDQGQNCSPNSGASSLSKAPASHTGRSGGPGNISPGVAAAGAFSSRNTMQIQQVAYDPLATAGPAEDAYPFSDMHRPWASMLAAHYRQPSGYIHQQQAWSQYGSPEAGRATSALSAYGQLAARHLGSAALGAEQPVAMGEACSGDIDTTSVVIASAEQPQLVCTEKEAAATGDWPDLPDADNLMLVGKGLVQVMNLLGAGTAARLSLTRALRAMSSQDREWLLSITYPHLQDSCKRRAVAELKMILNEVVGMDCFASSHSQ